MIRDVLIINQAGLPLVALNFGECHSFKSNPSQFASTISILQQYCKNFTGKEINIIKMNKLHIGFHTQDNLEFCIIFDADDTTHNALSKIEQIAHLFLNNYKDVLPIFNGNIKIFHEFSDLLIKSKIAQKNCGEYADCRECPNSKKSLDLSDLVSPRHVKERLPPIIDA